MYPFIIAALLLLILSPVVALLLMKPDGRYHCHVPGCNESYQDLNNFIGHLKSEHDYTSIMIGEILGEIISRR